MNRTLQLPGLSPAVNQVILHFISVFVLAFGTQLVAGTTGTVHVSSLLALLTSAAAAGLVAVAHVVLGLIPSTPADGVVIEGKRYNQLGISLKVKTKMYQFWTSVVIMFLSILGASLVAGASGITSLPGIIAVVLAAISAAVVGVVQFVIGLIPAPAA